MQYAAYCDSTLVFYRDPPKDKPHGKALSLATSERISQVAVIESLGLWESNRHPLDWSVSWS